MGKDGIRQPAPWQWRFQIDVAPEAVVGRGGGLHHWNHSPVDAVGNILRKHRQRCGPLDQQPQLIRRIGKIASGSPVLASEFEMDSQSWL